jgi:hypothetical protein
LHKKILTGLPEKEKVENLRSGLKTLKNRMKAFSLNADRADRADWRNNFFKNNPLYPPDPLDPRSKYCFF